VELTADGPASHFEGLNLRLYNPKSHQWSLNFANINDGTLTQPTVGEFKNGRGEFFDQETLNGRAILVRFVVSDITPDSCRFEQAFSDDGGKTWEVNWIAIDTRVKDESNKRTERRRLPSRGSRDLNTINAILDAANTSDSVSMAQPPVWAGILPLSLEAKPPVTRFSTGRGVPGCQNTF
jgi:hypothetical protein